MLKLCILDLGSEPLWHYIELYCAGWCISLGEWQHIIRFIYDITDTTDIVFAGCPAFTDIINNTSDWNFPLKKIINKRKGLHHHSPGNF